MQEDLRYILVHQDIKYGKEILTPDCLKFLGELHRNFNHERKVRLLDREVRQKLFDQGIKPTFPPETKTIRESNWQVKPYPRELDKRWIEITGPADFKMSINAMNSGADVYMTDFEDSLAPTFGNLITGQKALIEINKKTIVFHTQKKEYKLKKGNLPTLIVRPRGWHLEEWNVTCDGEPMSGSMFDFGVYFYHNYKLRMQKYGGVFYYLPKMESYKEARLWENIFDFTEKYFNVPQGTIRCTVLIETILGGLEVEEILYELKNHITACNAGRWDYIFSCIKKFRNQKDCVLPDRLDITMTVPFMRAYTERLVQVCHKRGAHAIGGMAAFIPVHNDQKHNEFVHNKILEDKGREVKDGFDGSWVAHPDLVKIARSVFEKNLGNKDHQKDVLRQDVNVTADMMLDFRINKPITETGVRNNISVCFQYIYNWLCGRGAVNIFNLMEDAATAEISRSQLWQWIRTQCKTEKGQLITPQLYNQLKAEELLKYKNTMKDKVVLQRAIDLVDSLVLNEKFYDFLTTQAYQNLIILEQTLGKI